MSGFLIYMCILCALSVTLSVIVFVKPPSSKFPERLVEICELLREIATTLNDIHANMGKQTATLVKSSIESSDFLDKIRERLIQAIEEYDMMKSARFERIDEFQPIESIDDSITEPDTPIAQGMAFDELEVAVSKQDSVQQYGDRFFVDNFGPDKKNNGKTIWIRKSFHENLWRIATRSCAEDGNMTTYLDNIIADHFERYKEVIEAINQGKYIPEKYKDYCL
ncbi:MAG: DUF3408 domain-containing protein [Muribaculum sp.]|nr:DUF3408 domain-containing protein [Muribaculum sp.]